MTPSFTHATVNRALALTHRLYSWRTLRGVGLLALGAFAALAPRADAQREETTTPAAPLVMPQYSTLTSTDGTIQASRLPVTYNGKAYYVDLTLALTAEVSSQGVVTIAVAPTSVASPVLVVGGFKAGTYVGPSSLYGGKTMIVVTGPSPLPNGGTVWTVSVPNGASPNTYPDTAVFYVEPIADNPLAARLSAAKITSPDYAYGVGSTGEGWCRNSLLGFAQAGNSLSISNFDNSSGCAVDHSTVQDSIAYTLQP